MKVFIERRISRIEQKIEDLKAEKLPDHPVYRGKHYDIGYWEGALSAYETMLDRVTEEEEDTLGRIDYIAISPSEYEEQQSWEGPKEYWDGPKVDSEGILNDPERE